MAKRPMNDGASWNAAEIKRLQGFAKKGLSATDTARELGRTPAAVQQKAMREGISFRASRRRPEALKKKSTPVKSGVRSAAGAVAKKK